MVKFCFILFCFSGQLTYLGSGYTFQPIWVQMSFQFSESLQCYSDLSACVLPSGWSGTSLVVNPLDLLSKPLVCCSESDLHLHSSEVSQKLTNIL